jgi:SAM-dependent methyltransferase
MNEVSPAAIDVEQLRCQISDKYTAVATSPHAGFHFHTGASLAEMLGYPVEQYKRLPQGTIDSFAGTGNPFSMGALRSGETVVDVGCGAGFDTLIAAAMVGPSGRVIAIDMTEAMRRKAAAAAREVGYRNVDIREGYAEALPVDDKSADVLISNGVINLTPDKERVMREVYRVLKPGGRLQVGDIVVHKLVPQDAKDDIDLWSG